MNDPFQSGFDSQSRQEIESIGGLTPPATYIFVVFTPIAPRSRQDYSRIVPSPPDSRKRFELHRTGRVRPPLRSYRS